MNIYRYGRQGTGSAGLDRIYISVGQVEQAARSNIYIPYERGLVFPPSSSRAQGHLKC